MVHVNLYLLVTMNMQSLNEQQGQSYYQKWQPGEIKQRFLRKNQWPFVVNFALDMGYNPKLSVQYSAVLSCRQFPQTAEEGGRGVALPSDSHIPASAKSIYRRVYGNTGVGGKLLTFCPSSLLLPRAFHHLRPTVERRRKNWECEEVFPPQKGVSQYKN